MTLHKMTDAFTFWKLQLRQTLAGGRRLLICVLSAARSGGCGDQHGAQERPRLPPRSAPRAAHLLAAPLACPPSSAAA